MVAHTVVERDFAAVAERRVAEIVGEAQGLDQRQGRQIGRRRMVGGIGRQVLDQAASDLSDLKRVRQARAVEIAVAEIENLCLALQPAERR